jgi:hypothetical protein
MTPNHSGGPATFTRPLATASDSSALDVLGFPAVSSAAVSGIRWASSTITRRPAGAR